MQLSGKDARRVRPRVVLPVAGRGTRLWPMTRVLPKALFPMVDASGIKSVLHCILEQVRDSGLDEVAIVVSPGQAQTLEDYLAAAGPGHGLPSTICFIEQTQARGFGDAVMSARSFAEDRPFVVLLGDHVHISDAGAKPCIAQVLDAFGVHGGAAMIGVQEVPSSELSRVGVGSGEPVGHSVYRCEEFAEKPDLATAQQRLRTPGLADGTFLAHCGIYLFTPEIFDCLDQEQRVRGGLGPEKAPEVELAAAQVRLLKRHPTDYYLYRIQGRAYDMGTPEGYVSSFMAWAGKGCSTDKGGWIDYGSSQII